MTAGGLRRLTGSWKGWRGFDCAAAAVLVCLGCGDPGRGKVLAEVNGELLSGADLDLYEAARPEGLRSATGELDAQQELLSQMGLLRELVDQRVLLQRAAAQGVAVPDRAVDEAFERHCMAYGSEEQLADSLAGSGIDVGRFRGELRRQLTVEWMLDREVGARVRVSEDEMRGYYDRHKAAFAVPEQQLRLSQILVADTQVSPVPNARNDDVTGLEPARRKIRRIQEELEDGADFAELALHYSEDPAYAINGGDMGFLPLSALEKADVGLRRALVALQPGEISPIIQTGGEFRILRLVAVEEPGQRAFDDPAVQESIRDVLFNRKEQLLRTAIITVERNRATIRNLLAEGVAEGDGIE